MRSRLSTIVLLAASLFLFTAAVSVVGFWKYAYYRYQGMDLAIYANVLWSLAHGGGWWSSIQGSPYLGDHVEPILLLFVPIFRLWSDPRLLIMLQALALGLTAIPVHLLLSSSRAEPFGSAQDRLREAERSPERSNGDVSTRPGLGRHDEGGRGKAPLLAVLWLLNPLLWNAALFEFHALAFAPLFLLSAAYAYVRRRFSWFLFWTVLSLSVREDVALIVVMFGVVVAVDRWRGTTISPLPPQWRGSERGRGWMLAPIIFGLAWFLLATRIAAAHSPSGAYKFLIYYGWLRDVASHPLVLLRHIMSIGNIDMAVGLLLPFLFLPILRARWLLLAIPPFLQILLAGPGGSSIVVETHYALLFLPALTLASIEVINVCSPPFKKGEREGDRVQPRLLRWLAYRFPLPRPFAIALGVATYLAAAILIGPFPGIARIVAHGASPDDRVRRAAYDALLARVPLDASIAVGYAALPHVAARRGAHSLAYAYLGVNQYAFTPYELPATTRYLLLDQRDAMTYAVQFPDVGWSAPHAVGGPDRLRHIVTAGAFGTVAERDGIALLERGTASSTNFVIDQRYVQSSQPVHGRLAIDGLRDVTVQVDQ